MTKFLLLFFFVINLIAAQNFIEGKIREVKTGKPVFMANIYLDGTTIGTTSDENGNFLIKNVPHGSYKLIVSMIGYERQILSVKIPNVIGRKFDVKLKPKEYELNEISVVAEENDEWQDNYDDFRDAFMGTSRIAKGATIRNPEVINFSRNEKDNLVASTDKIIIVDHNSMGYEIQVNLVNFEWDTMYDYGAFKVHTFYKEKDTSDAELMKTWEKNRDISYKGSVRHFLRSLAANRLYEENFRMFYSDKELIDQYSIHYQMYFDSKKDVDTVYKLLVKPRFFDFQAVETYGPLTVYYMADEDVDYVYYKENYKTGPGLNLQTQLSWIKTINGPLLIDKTGDYDDFNQTIQVQGYWAWKRFADRVPADYFPGKPSDNLSKK